MHIRRMAPPKAVSRDYTNFHGTWVIYGECLIAYGITD